MDLIEKDGQIKSAVEKALEGQNPTHLQESVDVPDQKKTVIVKPREYVLKAELTENEKTGQIEKLHLSLPKGLDKENNEIYGSADLDKACFLLQALQNQVNMAMAIQLRPQQPIIQKPKDNIFQKGLGKIIGKR
jgi:hypothetical protein